MGVETKAQRMNKELWNVPETLAGVTTVRARIDECLAKGDELEAAWGTLALSRLVKWAPWDENGFQVERAGPLAERALEIFRRFDEKRGIIRSLRACIVFTPKEKADAILDEAEALATEIGDEHELAHTLAAKGRSPWRSKEEKQGFNQRALEIFRRKDDQSSAAMVLFSMSIGNWGPQGGAYALESAQLYRELGEHAHSARSFTMAVTHFENQSDLASRKALAEQGMAEAIASGTRSLELTFVREFAEIGIAEGRTGELQTFIHRWEESQPASSGEVDKVENHNARQMYRRLRNLALEHGNQAAVKMIESELSRLRKLITGLS